MWWPKTGRDITHKERVGFVRFFGGEIILYARFLELSQHRGIFICYVPFFRDTMGGWMDGMLDRPRSGKSALFATTSAGLGYPPGAQCSGTTYSRARATREPVCARPARPRLPGNIRGTCPPLELARGLLRLEANWFCRRREEIIPSPADDSRRGYIDLHRHHHAYLFCKFKR